MGNVLKSKPLQGRRGRMPTGPGGGGTRSDLHSQGQEKFAAENHNLGRKLVGNKKKTTKVKRLQKSEWWSA